MYDLFSVTLSDAFQGHGVIDAVDVLCSQLTRDLFAVAKFLFTPCPAGGAENDGHEIAGHEIDGPSCRA